MVRDGALKVERYWEMPEDHLDIQSSDIAVEQFRELLTDAIRIHLRSDVSVGTCLSGGLDSSSIVFIIDRLLHEGNIDDAQIGNRQRTLAPFIRKKVLSMSVKYIDRVLDQIRASGCFTLSHCR
jgi:asparagine synthase (glutamine-hydrolysing)